jgi:hypothetical protein
MKATGENVRHCWSILLFTLVAVFCLIGVQTSAQDYSACEQVVTNADQLASVFTCDVFCLPSTPPDFPAWLIDPQFLWADFTSLPTEFSAVFAQSQDQVQGITVLKVRLTRWILSGETTVELPSGTTSLTLAAPNGYQASEQHDWATRSALVDWQQWIDWGVLDATTEPTLRLSIALANVQDKPMYDAMLEAEDAACGEASALTSLGSALMLDSEDSGGYSLLLLSQDGTPCGASKFNKLQVQGTNFFLEWFSITNATYEIASATDLTIPASNWITLASLYPATTGTNVTSFVDVGGAVNTGKFYKVAKTGISILLCDSNTYSGTVDIPVEVGMPTNKILSGLAFLVDDDGSRAMIDPQPPFTSRPSGTFDTTLVTNGWHTIQALASYPNGAVDGGYDVYTSQVVVVRTQNHVTFPDMLLTWRDKLAVRATLDIQITNWTASILSPSNQILQSYSGITSNGKIDFVWDGKDSNGVTFAGDYVTFEIDDPVRRLVPRSGPPPSGYFIVSYMPLFPDFSHGLMDFQNMIDNVAETVDGGGFGPYSLVIGNDTSGAWQIPDTAGGAYGWTEWAVQLASNSTHNLFFFGHGSNNSIGNRDTNPNSGFKVSELAPALGNTIGIGTNGFKQPFHFVFLDACNAANGPWCEAFGIERTATTSQYYITNGLSQCAFASWRKAKGYAVANNIFNQAHKNFIINLFNRWSTTTSGFQDAVNFAASVTAGASGYPSDMRIWGATDLLWNSP